MSRKTVRKLIFTLVFIFILVIAFLLNHEYKKYKRTTTVSLIKQIINEKYDRVDYSLDDNYLYAYNYSGGIFYYTIFDLNGNEIDTFQTIRELNIVGLSEDYYITYSDDMYHLYNLSNVEIATSNNMVRLNDNLIQTNDSIIDSNGKELFKDVKDVSSYHNDRYFNINNNIFINEDGEVVYDDCDVMAEIKNSFITDYLILKMSNKYYTYFPSIKNIVGSSFESFFIEDDEVFEYSYGEWYKILSSGVRSKINTIKLEEYDEKYILSSKDIINTRFIVARDINDSSYGILDMRTDNYYSLLKDYKKFIKLNDSYCLVIGEKESVIFNLDDLKEVYRSANDISSIIYYENNYKTIKHNNEYVLLDEKDNEIIKSDKQIIIDNSRVLCGVFDEEVQVYKDKKMINGNITIVDGKEYVYYENNNKILRNLYTGKNYTSDKFISNTNNYIVVENNNKLELYDVSDDTKDEYNLDDEKILSNVFKNIIIVGNEDSVKFITMTGKTFKEEDDIEIKKVYYNKRINKIVIITTNGSNNNVKEGSYVCE